MDESRGDGLGGKQMIGQEDGRAGENMGQAKCERSRPVIPGMQVKAEKITGPDSANEGRRVGRGAGERRVFQGKIGTLEDWIRE